MTLRSVPHKVSAGIVVGLIVATTALAAGAVVTSMDTLIPLLKGEPWAQSRALSEHTYALHVQVTVPDVRNLDLAEGTGDSSRICIEGELPVIGYSIEVREPGPLQDVPGPLVATGVTDDHGRLTFDLKPGRYVVQSHKSLAQPLVMDADKMAWFELGVPRWTQVDPRNGTVDGPGQRIGLSSGGEWILFDRAKVIEQGPAHAVTILPTGDFDGANVTATFEPIGRDGGTGASWTENWHTGRSWRIALAEGSYRLNLTWENGRTAETTFLVDQRMSVRTVWTDGQPSLVVNSRYPICS